MALKKHNNQALEKEAASFLSEHGIFSGRVFLIEHVLQSMGFTIWPVSGLKAKFEVEAYVPAHGNNVYVEQSDYDKNPPSVRFRFTLTEELAHIILHWPHFKNLPASEIEKLNSEMTDTEYQQIEHEAKYLAAALLMPQESYKERFEHHLESRKGSGANGLSKLRFVILRMYDEFYVSCNAAIIRASSLGLIDGRQTADLLVDFKSVNQ